MPHLPSHLLADPCLSVYRVVSFPHTLINVALPLRESLASTTSPHCAPWLITAAVTARRYERGATQVKTSVVTKDLQIYCAYHRHRRGVKIFDG